MSYVEREHTVPLTEIQKVERIGVLLLYVSI